MIACFDCDIYRVMRNRAYEAVRQARLKGVLPHPQSLPCVDCGAQAYGYDHRDYGSPLLVAAVCRSCNGKRGTAKYSGIEQARARYLKWCRKWS